MIDEEIATLKNDLRELSSDFRELNERFFRELNELLSKLENNNQAAEIGPRNEDCVF